ncbi:SDR family oxidoreductase [Candidatus Daviesbacteria bacterium]|nr:SDR family oxidoreductase [Candidatus Daviesbacteria bacterium]
MSMPESLTGKPLTGQVFLLTGASRGIGAATALELARRGAVVIGPHRDPGKDSRAAEVVRQVEEIGGRMVAPVADVTRPEHRASLLAQIKQDFGKIDGIIFNHAGGMEKDLLEASPNYHLEVNGYSKLYLFQEAELARILQGRSVVIDVPSLWSTFYHTGIEQLPQYTPVAIGKKLGEQLLKKATRDYNQFDQQAGEHVTFGSVCGHAIEGTTTIKLLRRMNPEAMQAVEQTAEGGKLPTIADMANAIAFMAEGDFADEDIVFVGVPQIRPGEMPDVLPMYSGETRYVNRLVGLDRQRFVGYYRVREKDTRFHFDDADGSLDSSSDRAILDVRRNHTIGHFTPEFGISVFPGHKMIAACEEVAENNFANITHGEVIDPRLARIEGPIAFKIPVLPGDRLSIEIDHPDASLKIGNTEVASIKGLQFEERAWAAPRRRGMGFDRLIEAAAQTLGLAYLFREGVKDVLPLFSGVRGPVEYLRDVYPGEQLEMEAVLAEGEGKNRFRGDVNIRVDDQVVAKVLGIDCRLSPIRGIGRVISLGRMILG